MSKVRYLRFDQHEGQKCPAYWKEIEKHFVDVASAKRFIFRIRENIIVRNIRLYER